MNNKLINTKWFLYLTEFFAGMSVMAVELGASRLMAPYFSSSQIVWTVIIGVIMIAMAVGNVWGGSMADKSKSPDRLYRRDMDSSHPICRALEDSRYIVPACDVHHEEFPRLGGVRGMPAHIRLPLRPARHRYPVADEVHGR